MADGQIHDHLVGKVIKSVLHDKDRLIIETTDSHQIRIVWKSNEPVLEGVDVKFELTGTESIALANI